MNIVKATLASPFFSALSQRLLSLLNSQPQLGLCILTVGGFFVFKNSLNVLHGQTETRLALLALVCAAAFLLVRQLTTAELPAIVRNTLRGIAALFAFYMLFATPTLVAGITPQNFIVEAYIYQGLGVAFFVLGCWRAAWLLPAFVALRWQKYVVEDLAGMTISFTDYGPVLEFGCSVTLGVLIFYYGKRWVAGWHSSKAMELSPLEAVFLTAVAVHFSNYFYSGLQKIIISDPWWQWTWENPTYYLMLSAWETGQLPLTYLAPEITAQLYEAFVKYVVPLNILTIGLQLGAIVAILRIRWAAVMTAMYDVTHVVIFITSGIFFYKWIWLNLLIVWSLALISHKRINNLLKAWLVGIMLIAPGGFFVARLGWFDSPSFNDEYVLAVTGNGDSYRVPTNYFFGPSITHAQQRLVKEKPGFFLTGAYGSIYEKVLPYLSFEEAQNCVLPANSSKGIAETAAQRGLGKYMRNHHAFVLQHIDAEGRILYDAYPHHIFSMYWDFMDFHNLDKREIVRYQYVVEANCLTYNNGRPQHLTLKRETYDIPVQNTLTRSNY